MQIPQGSNTGLTYTSGGTSAPVTFATAANAITKLRDTLGGTTAETKESTIDKVYAADSNAVAYTRTPSQVCLCPR